MSAKLKMYPRRIGWIGWNDGNRFNWKKRDNGHQARVRVVDARELTAEKAVERVFNQLHGVADWEERHLKELAAKIDMTATVKNGKVRVRRVNR